MYLYENVVITAHYTQTLIFLYYTSTIERFDMIQVIKHV